jgi:hypothetical protein
MIKLGCLSCHTLFEPQRPGTWQPRCPLCNHKSFMAWAGSPEWETAQQQEWLASNALLQHTLAQELCSVFAEAQTPIQSTAASELVQRCTPPHGIRIEVKP